jgi:quercetin dioxygenase-like cupin family protein
MKIIDTQEVSHSDERGVIIDLITDNPINAVSYVTLKKGFIRGNHYHKYTTQYNYVISGKLLVVTQKEDEGKSKTILDKGSMCMTIPMEKHAMYALEDTEIMVFTKGPDGGKEFQSDTFPLLEPLIR